MDKQKIVEKIKKAVKFAEQATDEIVSKINALSDEEVQKRFGSSKQELINKVKDIDLKPEQLKEIELKLLNSDNLSEENNLGDSMEPENKEKPQNQTEHDEEEDKTKLQEQEDELNDDEELTEDATQATTANGANHPEETSDTKLPSANPKPEDNKVKVTDKPAAPEDNKVKTEQEGDDEEDTKDKVAELEEKIRKLEDFNDEFAQKVTEVLEQAVGEIKQLKDNEQQNQTESDEEDDDEEKPQPEPPTVEKKLTSSFYEAVDLKKTENKKEKLVKSFSRFVGK